MEHKTLRDWAPLYGLSALSLIKYQKITEVCVDGDEIAGHQRESAGQDITNVTRAQGWVGVRSQEDIICMMFFRTISLDIQLVTG